MHPWQPYYPVVYSPVLLPGCTSLCPAPDHGADTALTAGMTPRVAQKGKTPWVGEVPIPKVLKSVTVMRECLRRVTPLFPVLKS